MRKIFLLVLFLPLLLSHSPLKASVVINEIAFDESSGSDWIELYNNGDGPISINGWVLEDGDTGVSREIQIQLSTPIPSGGYVLVYIDEEGVDETDFSDFFVSLYSGTNTTLNLAVTEDELSLYRSVDQSSTTIVDFVAWVSDGDYGGVRDQLHAIEAGLWREGESVVTEDTGSGYSIGRFPNGEDTNMTVDFFQFEITSPGTQNQSGEICGNNLDDDNDQQTDCQDSDCFVIKECQQKGFVGQVVINEVSWGGSAASGSHEWIELYNPHQETVNLHGWRLFSEDQGIDFFLETVIPAQSYLLLERTSDQSVSSIAADQLYTGTLSNSGENLRLIDISSFSVDTVSFLEEGWPAGTASPDYRTMERRDPFSSGNLISNWVTNDGVKRSGMDAEGNPLNGTPREQNSFGWLQNEISESCGNGLDDDGNQLVDCADPDCFNNEICLSHHSQSALWVDPNYNPFSPRDPSRDRAKIFFNVTGDSIVKTLRVFNLHGEIIRVLLNNDVGERGLLYEGISQGLLEWDGRDFSGKKVPRGIYILLLEGRDFISGDALLKKETVVVGR